MSHQHVCAGERKELSRTQRAEQIIAQSMDHGEKNSGTLDRIFERQLPAQPFIYRGLVSGNSYSHGSHSLARGSEQCSPAKRRMHIGTPIWLLQGYLQLT